ncbi:MAG: RNA chaperone Hfq [Candidatus Wallbacteria bacterium GWC2_49_35]|uniref:RNA-binding protein Hfq n=1 Tax=Candidatus Wallbacteria bacterium GWC2_49_35 TaxID=1817813 RepID=A0A1F7WF38_9BACT|nr:MAG: RNA chaperone Hfq [Candidatus Wallbacteria bacterium GWC2_49_35]HBC75753.1 RNA chaperone Hfq [Candidatus Wallbacteria bacterium]
MSKVNIQDVFLNAVRKDKIPITIYTMNGVKIMGNVISFDTFTVMLNTNVGQQLIFKHAVSTIIPSKNVSLMIEDDPKVKPASDNGQESK